MLSMFSSTSLASSSSSLPLLLSISNLIGASVSLRIGFFLFGLYQDKHMAVKYTDIDYLVFSDAASYVNYGQSPYLRETYRYTPLLSWLLVPNSFLDYSFGKILFIFSDLVTGLVIIDILKLMKLSEKKIVIMSSIWLLNPMVITISTRGSSESILTVFIMLSAYYILKRRIIFGGIMSGMAIHFKIYPVIYLPTIILFLSDYQSPLQFLKKPWLTVNKDTILFLIAAIISFSSLSILMYKIYGYEFLYHSYLYHFVRTDHRHNFSIYNISLYFTSAGLSGSSLWHLDFTKIAFIPQLLFSAFLIPIAFTKKSFINTLLLQTLIFVTFNKVMTSQYFIWYLIYLPIFLTRSELLRTKKLKGVLCLLLWVVSQGTWLYNAFNLEFLGISNFTPALLGSSVFFFLSNVYIIGVFIDSTNGLEITDGI
ncbi:hypothetical protein WICMUC_002021 [Wickerhamomyces mucosus]|uniref:GPI mannosyltransferase 1 n=1 Tax=Wickerhamomyces mucosus TaxID=1378264 RepID=A0A9P8PRL5_9ASCO|nr:hypothetical protein WICMUC_002021 [Wickerhamomyces mucosus]